MSIEFATINTIHWPFVHIKFNNVQLNNILFESYTKNYLQLLIKSKKMKEKIYIIFDINCFDTLPIPYLLRLSQFNKKIFSYNQKHLNCVYMYCKNKMFKKMIKTFAAMEKTAAPFIIVRSLSKLNKSILDNYNIHFDAHVFFDTENDNNIDEFIQKENYDIIVNNNINELIQKEDVDTNINDELNILNE